MLSSAVGVVLAARLDDALERVAQVDGRGAPVETEARRHQTAGATPPHPDLEDVSVECCHLAHETPDRRAGRRRRASRSGRSAGWVLELRVGPPRRVGGVRDDHLMLHRRLLAAQPGDLEHALEAAVLAQGSGDVLQHGLADLLDLLARRAAHADPIPPGRLGSGWSTAPARARPRAAQTGCGDATAEQPSTLAASRSVAEVVRGMKTLSETNTTGSRSPSYPPASTAGRTAASDVEQAGLRCARPAPTDTSRRATRGSRARPRW